MTLIALPDGAVPLVVGTVLALGALTLVLSPLLSGEAEVRAEDEQKAECDEGIDKTLDESGEKDVAAECECQDHVRPPLRKGTRLEGDRRVRVVLGRVLRIGPGRVP